MSVRCRTFVLVSMVFLSSLAARPVCAQTGAILRGAVVAAADGSAVPGAGVILRSASGGEAGRTTTDAAGRFAFPQVAPGEYVIAVALEGFVSYETHVTLEPREVRTVDARLELAAVNVAVDVAAAAAFAGTHSPGSTVLSAARIETLPPSERAALPDALVSAAPGMIRGHDDFVHIRGQEIALNPLIDGVSFWENPHAVFSASVTPEIIDTANVMTGGFPAEYGNRFGGVVDIVTKSGLRLDRRGMIGVTLGQAGRRRAAGDVGGRRERFAYYLFGDLSATDRFLSPPDPEAIHDAARGGHAFARVDTGGDGVGLFNTMLMADGLDAEIPVTPVDVELRPDATAEQRARQQTAMLGWTRVWSARTLVDASLYQRWSRLRLLPASGPLTARADLTRELLTIGGKATVTRLAGPHTVRAGLDLVRLRPSEHLYYDYRGYRELTHLLELPHIHVADQTIAFAGREAGGQASGFLQDQIQIGDRVTVNLGARFDHYALAVSATHLSPRVNLAFQGGSGVQLHASYNRFFVPPAIEGILSSSAGLTRRIQEIGRALPPLAATTEDQFEFGASTSAGPATLAATGYYRSTDNPVHTTVWPDSRIYSYASFGRARAYGLELRGEAPGLARFGVTAYANYALSRVDFWNPVTGGFITEASHLTDTSRFLAPMDQTHTLTGGASYRHRSSGVWAAVSVEHGSGTPIGHGGSAHEHADAGADPHSHAADVGGRVPGHVRPDVSLGIDLFRRPEGPRLAIRFDVENVTNRPYVIARASQFSPAQYARPRLVALTARVGF